MGNVCSLIIAKKGLSFQSRPVVWRAEEGLEAQSQGSASFSGPLSHTQETISGTS